MTSTSTSGQPPARKKTLSAPSTFPPTGSGAPDAAFAAELRHQRRAAAARDHCRAGAGQEGSATVNHALGLLDAKKSQAINAAADEVLAGQHPGEFPLVVWQTGSGTQTNMNVNEVLANRASELLGGERGESRLVHPNDDVNKSQSSNDVYPTAMHVAAVTAIEQKLLPAIAKLRTTLQAKSEAFADIVKIGRTHLQDATPLTLGQEISGWVAQLAHGEKHARRAAASVRAGAGRHGRGHGPECAQGLCRRGGGRAGQLTGYPFVTSPNKFESLAAATAGARPWRAQDPGRQHDEDRQRCALAGQRPRSGLGELSIPENEPGSSIMPGKVNPTQSEAVTMLCAQVFGNDVAINFGGASGNFELNVFRPLVAHNFLQSVRLLADGMVSFNDHCAVGIEPNRERIAELVSRSLMLVTALNTHIGYDKAAYIAKKAHKEGTSLRDAAIASGHVTAEQFDQWVVAKDMVGNL
jgi:fumarate hydratase class II